MMDDQAEANVERFARSWGRCMGMALALQAVAAREPESSRVRRTVMASLALAPTIDWAKLADLCEEQERTLRQLVGS